MIFSKKNPLGNFVRSNDLLNEANIKKSRFSELMNLENPSELKISNILSLYKYGRSVAGENGKYLGTRKDNVSPYSWVTYGEFNEMASACAAGLASLDIDSGNDVRLAVYCRMGVELYSLIIGAIKRRNVIVTLYDTLGMESIKHVVDETTPKMAFCDSEKYVDALLEIPSFKATHIFVSFLITTEIQHKADAHGIILLSVADLIKIGYSNKDDFLDREDGPADDLVSILYTSGSSGTPKGVQLTHRQYVFNVLSIIRHTTCEDNCFATDDLVYYSYLPFQHSFENIALVFCSAIGAKIGISQGNLKLITSDLAELKPTLLVAVPRVLHRFMERINEGVGNSNFILSSIFNWKMNHGKRQLLANGHYSIGLLDNLIFRKVYQIFGGNLKYIVVGGAPMSRDIELFSRAVLGVQLLHGYGLTETMAASVVQSVGNRGVGNCGAPLAGVEVKLVDVPELGYFSSKGFGEIYIRGPNVMTGYFNRPDLTKEAFDEDGFFKSGDIGMINEDGTFTIIDRSKNIFKLSQGEYIMCEKIENIYVKHPLVKQIMVYGDSTKDHLLAVIIVDKEYLSKFAQGLHTNGDSGEALLENKNVRLKLLDELTKMGKKANLVGFEQIKGFVLDFNEFTSANELLTPTFKIRRPIVTKRYYDRLQALYNK